MTRGKGEEKEKEKRNAAETPSVGEKKRIGNYPWIVRKCSKGSTGRTSEPSGKWTMEIVGEAAMARRLYKGPQSKISRSLCFFHESRDRAPLFQSEEKYIPDCVAPRSNFPPRPPLCLRQPFEITFPRLTSSWYTSQTDRGDRDKTKVTLLLRWIRFDEN